MFGWGCLDRARASAARAFAPRASAAAGRRRRFTATGASAQSLRGSEGRRGGGGVMIGGCVILE